MRLWSIHPVYLDRIGLVACWRESLLAKKVLENKTKGYRNHPQLNRFKLFPNPLNAINAYLFQIYLESQKRKFNFDSGKIEKLTLTEIITVNNEQISYEFRHLQSKLRLRDKEQFDANSQIKIIKANPVFSIVAGGIEKWEIIK